MNCSGSMWVLWIISNPITTWLWPRSWKWLLGLLTLTILCIVLTTKMAWSILEWEDYLTTVYYCFRKLVHPNILQFFGMTTLKEEGKIGMVVELCQENLETYSKKGQSTQATPEQVVCVFFLLFSCKLISYTRYNTLVKYFGIWGDCVIN